MRWIPTEKRFHKSYTVFAVRQVTIQTPTQAIEREEKIMARVALITRTVKRQHIKAIALDLNTNQSATVELTVPQGVKSEKDIIKYVDERTDEHIKPVKVIEAEIIESRYAMSEDDFINLAQEIPLRGANTEENTEEQAEDTDYAE
jgi:HD-GYP domain-containing protein (c-di-GMP phosphodiesterase class II)